MPSDDESFQAMTEIVLTNLEWIQTCCWLLKFNHLRETYRDAGLSYFNNGQDTGHHGVEQVLACICKRREKFICVKEAI